MAMRLSLTIISEIAKASGAMLKEGDPQPCVEVAYRWRNIVHDILLMTNALDQFATRYAEENKITFSPDVLAMMVQLDRTIDEALDSGVPDEMQELRAMSDLRRDMQRRSNRHRN